MDYTTTETYCGLLCQHPTCWETRRREECGLLRQLDRGFHKEAKYEALPTQHIVNLFKEFNSGPVDQLVNDISYAKKNVGDSWSPQHSFGSLCKSSRPRVPQVTPAVSPSASLCSVESPLPCDSKDESTVPQDGMQCNSLARQQQRSDGSKQRLVDGGQNSLGSVQKNAASRTRHQHVATATTGDMSLLHHIKVHELFDARDLRRRWNDTFTPRNYYVWVPNGKAKVVNGATNQLPQASATRGRIVIKDLFANVALNSIQPAPVMRTRTLIKSPRSVQTRQKSSTDVRPHSESSEIPLEAGKSSSASKNLVLCGRAKFKPADTRYTCASDVVAGRDRSENLNAHDDKDDNAGEHLSPVMMAEDQLSFITLHAAAAADLRLSSVSKQSVDPSIIPNVTQEAGTSAAVTGAAIATAAVQHDTDAVGDEDANQNLGVGLAQSHVKPDQSPVLLQLPVQPRTPEAIPVRRYAIALGPNAGLNLVPRPEMDAPHSVLRLSSVHIPSVPNAIPATPMVATPVIVLPADDLVGQELAAKSSANSDAGPARDTAAAGVKAAQAVQSPVKLLPLQQTLFLPPLPNTQRQPMLRNRAKSLTPLSSSVALPLGSAGLASRQYSSPKPRPKSVMTFRPEPTPPPPSPDSDKGLRGVSGCSEDDDDNDEAWKQFRDYHSLAVVRDGDGSDIVSYLRHDGSNAIRSQSGGDGGDDVAHRSRTTTTEHTVHHPPPIHRRIEGSDTAREGSVKASEEMIGETDHISHDLHSSGTDREGQPGITVSSQIVVPGVEMVLSAEPVADHVVYRQISTTDQNAESSDELAIVSAQTDLASEHTIVKADQKSSRKDVGLHNRRNAQKIQSIKGASSRQNCGRQSDPHDAENFECPSGSFTAGLQPILSFDCDQLPTCSHVRDGIPLADKSDLSSEVYRQELLDEYNKLMD